ISAALLRVERVVLIALTLAVTVLILLNVVTRSTGMALFWVDEAAIYTMIWAVFVGASMQVRLRAAISVDLVPMALGDTAKRVLGFMVDLLVLSFALTLIWLSFIWYDPIGLAQAGFDFGAFAGATFNFIYDEPTVTVGIPKFLIWLIMPILGLTLTVHSFANLADRLTGTPGPELEDLVAR
ncbi:MAG: TRAP transporter small permease subunit, partial [Pseudomonadota bacterium]